MFTSYCSTSFWLGEACWWTIHPASKQRSEGEKVRVGDDLILVSVATERYLVSDSETENNDSILLTCPARMSLRFCGRNPSPTAANESVE